MQEEDENINLKDIANFLKRRKKFISLISIGGFLASILYAFLKPPLWEGHFQIVLTNPKSSSDSRINNFLNQNQNLSKLIGINKEGNAIKTEITILKSPLVLRPVFNFVKQERIKNGETVEELNFRVWQKNNFVINLEEDTSVLNIYYRDLNKKLVLPVLNLISKDYQDYSGRNRRTGIDNGISYLNNQVSLYKTKSIIALKKLEDYGIQNKITLLKSNTTSFESNLSFDTNGFLNNSQNKDFLTDVETGRDKALSKILNIKSQIKSLDKLRVGKEDREIMYFGIKNQLFEENSLINQINQNEIELSRAKEIFSPTDILVRKLELQRKGLLAALKSQTIGFLEGQLIDAEDTLKIYERPQNVLVEYKQLYRDSKFTEETLAKLELKLQQLLLEKSKYEEPWELISNPYLLEKPVGLSKSQTILAGTFLGMLLGILISFIKEKSSNLIFSKGEFEKILNYPFLMTIPNAKETSLNEYIDILINTDLFINVKEDYCLIAPYSEGKFNPLFKNFAEELKKSLMPANIQICNKISEANKYKNKILLFTSGNLSKNELDKVINSLNLQKGTVLGWIYFDNTLDNLKDKNFRII